MSRVREPLSDRLLAIRAKVAMELQPEVLSDFEQGTIREAHRRCVYADGVMSTAERRVVEDAVAALIVARRPELSDRGLAA